MRPDTRLAAGACLACVLLSAAPARPAAPPARAIRILVVPTRAEAEEALALIRAGLMFERVVREKSIGPEPAQGGYLGYVDPASLSPEVRSAVARTRPGELSPIFRTGNGYAVIQVLTEAEERELRGREREARELLRRGTAHGQAGDVAEAVELLQQAVDRDPGLQDARFNLAIGLWKLDRPEEAIRSMEAASRLRPQDVEAQVRLGGWLLERGRAAEAAARYERAAALQPSSSAIGQRLAEAHEAAGNWQAAHRAYARLLTLLRREDPGILSAMLRAAMQAGDGPSAVDTARRLRRHRPGYDGLLALGEALLLNRDPEAAARELEMAVALAPSSVPARLRLAEALTALGRSDEAADQFFHLIRLEPGRPEHYSGLSRLYAQSGRLDLAIVVLRDGADAAASLPAPHRVEMLDELAGLYARAGMTREAERERQRAKGLRATTGTATGTEGKK